MQIHSLHLRAVERDSVLPYRYPHPSDPNLFQLPHYYLMTMPLIRCGQLSNMTHMGEHSCGPVLYGGRNPSVSHYLSVTILAPPVKLHLPFPTIPVPYQPYHSTFSATPCPLHSLLPHTPHAAYTYRPPPSYPTPPPLTTPTSSTQVCSDLMVRAMTYMTTFGCYHSPCHTVPCITTHYIALGLLACPLWAM